MSNFLNTSILSAFLKDGQLDANRRGLHNIDLLNEGIPYTPWDRIAKIVIDKETITITERTWTLKKDEKGKIYKHEYVPQALLEARKQSGMKAPNGQPLFNENGEFFRVLALPPYNDKRDPRVITVWTDIQGVVILWARQSHEFARLRDKRPVYNLDIPEFEFKFKQNYDDIEGLEGYKFDTRDEKTDPNTGISVRRTYGTKEELLKEIQEIAQVGHSLKIDLKKPTLPLDLVNQWTTIGVV